MSPDVAAVYGALFSKPVSRPLIGWRASCGFPSPAEDYVEGSLDIAAYLVKRRASTFYVRVRGDSMAGANTHPGNLPVVDQINRKFGAGKVRFAASGLKREWRTKCARRTPRYTTAWGEVLAV